MKKIKKIIAVSLIASLTLTIGNVNAFKKMDVCNYTGGDFSGNYYDLKCTKDGKPSEDIENKKFDNNSSITNTGSTYNNKENNFIHRLKKVELNLKHGFPALMSKEAKSATKDKQLCKIATSFDILNDDGTVKYTYYPQGCQPTFEYFEDNNTLLPSEYKKIETKDNTDNSGYDSMDFLDDLFGTSTNNTEVIDNVDNTENIDNTEDTDNSGDDSMDFLDDLFGKINNDSNISLKGSKFAKTIRDFNQEKIKIRVGKVEANVLASDMVYNAKVANLLKQIDKDLKIDSIKNSLAKNISNVSYSLSTYRNTTDAETKEVFKNKLVKDLQTLKKKYKILKNKDAMISATLEKRGQL